MSETIHVRLNYPLNHVKEPILYHLVKDYRLKPNIYQADIDVRVGGSLNLTLEGEPENVQAGVDFLRSLGVETTVIED